MQPYVPNPWLSEREKNAPKPIKNHHRSFNQGLAVLITRWFGSMTMFYILFIWMFGWMFLATQGIGFFKSDPYPFTFLLFLSNIVQLLALPILAVGQQVLSQASERQAAQTYKDAEAILKLQDEIHRLIKINNELTEEIHKVTLKMK